MSDLNSHIHQWLNVIQIMPMGKITVSTCTFYSLLESKPPMWWSVWTLTPLWCPVELVLVGKVMVSVVPIRKIWIWDGLQFYIVSSILCNLNEVYIYPLSLSLSCSCVIIGINPWSPRVLHHLKRHKALRVNLLFNIILLYKFSVQ